MSKLNRRVKTLIALTVTIVLMILMIAYGVLLPDNGLQTDLTNKNKSPSINHLFGTDWLGRDMFTRTMKGMTLSFSIGVLASLGSFCIAFTFSVIMIIFGKKANELVSYLIDLFLSIPHLVALIIISFSLGGGINGIVAGLALTHWPSLTRLLRTEIIQIKNEPYIQISKSFGKSNLFIALRHVMPQLVPQFFVGLVLLFPHAVLHEAAITFLGFGISPLKPAIGNILSESMQYLSAGQWWLFIFPGSVLFLVVMSAQVIGGNIRKLADPHYAQE